MHDGTMMILKGMEVLSLLSGREVEIIEVVKTAYEAHNRGESSLPHSTFLRFPKDPTSRIIALPAYLASGTGGAGVKWVSSFPANLAKGMDRASAVIILNAAETGRPIAVLEGSIISAKRTAASAALAASTLHSDRTVPAVGIIGCGLINFEVQNFLLATFPSIKRLFLYDVSCERAQQFGEACQKRFKGIHTEVLRDLQSLLRSSRLISIATTAIQPYISDLSAIAPGTTLLHLSLRDLAPEAILRCDNVVDDADHVCRAQTSVHLAEQLTDSRGFIRCNLADATMGAAPPKKDDESITVFSPFGLGVLDIAVAQMVYRAAVEQNCGTVIESFLPPTWTELV